MRWKPLWQDMEQEPADKRVRCQRHDLLPLGTITAIILEPEGDASLVERDQPPVRDGDAVGVARQIGEHRFGASERRLGIDDPALLSDRRQVAQERAPVGKLRQMAEEGELAALVERHQPRQEQPPEQAAQHAHGKQEGGARRYPARPIKRNAAAGHDHVDMRMVGHR